MQAVSQPEPLVEASLTHGGCQGLGQRYHKAGDLGGLLGHHIDLVLVCAAGQSRDAVAAGQSEDFDDMRAERCYLCTLF